MPRPPQIPQRKKSTPKVAKTQSAVDKATQLFQQGFALHQQGKLSEAYSLYEKVLSINPKHFDALNMYGTAQAQLGNFEEAVDFISRAIAINPKHASCYNNRGGALLKLEQLEAALDNFDQAVQLKPEYAEAHAKRGNVLLQLKRTEAALASYEQAIQLKPDYAEVYFNRGNALQELKQFAAALASFDRVIHIQPDDENAYFNRGNALLGLQQPEAALTSYDKAVQLKPDHADAHLNRGNTFLELKQPEAALASYEKAIQLKPDFAEAYRNSGNANRELKQLEAALACYETAFALKPGRDYLLGDLLHTQMYLCDWRIFEDGVNDLSNKLKNHLAVSTSFPTLALTDALATHYQAASLWSKDKHLINSALGTLTKSVSKDKIRIGYYSADFYNHATAYLMAELFERHDKSKFEIIGFSFGPPAQDAMRQRLEAAFSQFIDVRLQSDKDVAQFSRAMGIDIAIDLKGYTVDSRPGIFSYRAAPIQISYLGYPGTMAAEYIDYLIADPTLVPVESQKHYSEKIIYLPDSYQVNDRQRVIADTVYTRDALGLPQEGFVFCCFNNNYKITPPTFDGWMRILHAVPGGVLWLLEDNATAAVNLRKEAQARGIDPQRLVFAKRMVLPEHLARHRAADLFIDTLPCNAHTTASDALWAGLPVLTCMGESFASRVAGSLLNAIGMPELVTTTQADYEALAIDLALSPAKLAALKAKLERNRLTTPLFDTPRFTKHLEAAYMQVYQRYRDDLPSEHVYVGRVEVELEATERSDKAKKLFQQGFALHQQGKLNEARSVYEKVLNINPTHFDALNMIGAVELQLEKFEVAADFIARAIAIYPSFASCYSNRGTVFLGLKQPDAALDSYEQAIELKHDYAHAYFGRGNALMELKQPEAALVSYDKAIQLKPNYFEAYCSRGRTLLELQQLEAALASYEKAIQLNPNHAEAYRNHGDALFELNRPTAALASYKRAFELQPNFRCLLGSLLHTQMHLCDWQNFEGGVTNLSEKIKDNQYVSNSFPTLALTDALEMHYKAAFIWLKNIFPVNPVLGPLSKPSANDKICIGYYSADFHNHATAHLMAELFERHDKSKFEVIGFSFGPAAQDAMRQRLEAAFSQFIDVRLQSDKDVAQLSRTMGIDIAIDLKGYTADSRTGIFSYRAAPIQISYLGYPGTMAAEYIDYLIADPTLVPVQSQKYYSEKIIYLPDSYQVNDRQRAIADTVYSREALGLPQEGFVFCCFNNNYKITPPTFDGWMRILHAVPGSVLWLLEDNATAAVNLRKEAQARGIDPQRLVFAKRMVLPEHLARHRAADLFIDTLPCNAHTTASDALWAGLPVLTCMGESFASRVAGSLLNAIGMPELVTTTQADYEALAIDLALSPAKLAALKAKLERNRLTTPLFDTPRFTKHLEAAYAQVYQRYRDDLPLEHVYVDRVEAEVEATERSDKAEKLFQQGFALHQQGKLSEAYSLYEKVLSINPKHFDALNMYGTAQAQLGNFEEAVDFISRAIAINPKHASCYNNRGGALLKLEQLEAALNNFDQAIQLKPYYAEAYANRGNVLLQLKRTEAALVSYDQAIQLKPDYAEVYFNRGNALQELKQPTAALASFDQVIKLQPDDAKAYFNRGNALLELKQPEAAIASYDQAIQLKPNDVYAHINRGNALLKLRQPEGALASYDKAIQLKPEYADAHNNRGNTLSELNQLEDAIASYDKAIQLKPEYANAYNSRGNALLQLKQLEAALASYDKAIQLKSDCDDAYFNRGNVLLKLQQPEAALASYDKAIQLKPDYAAAYIGRATTLLKQGQMDAALASYQVAFELEPDFANLPGALLHTQMHVCDWQNFEGGLSNLSEKIKDNQYVSTSFPILALTDALAMHYKAAFILLKNIRPVNPVLGPISKPALKDKIRLGYYSADFHNHATAHLMAELFERHDKSKFEVIGFSFGPTAQDAMRQRLKAAFSQFIDVRLQPDKDLAQLSRTIGIDIAIDLKGYTADSRSGIFSYRAAPIQISYLGYPGTMAAKHIDYLIADPTLVPVESQKHYSEKIIYLPDSYQVNDRQRAIADTVYTRDALGLPQEGFVFCCFNNNYKITPPTFDGWMRILHAVPGSVLWLLEGNATAAVNLRKEAQARGTDPQRLVFAKHMDLPEHLARHRAADLFIDTLPCNAHTTASDALWAGLPVLTCMGESFASRVAGSLLNAIGMPELVTTTQADYEALAIDLALNPAKIAALKAKLEENRLTTPLFDTPRFTKHIEAAYAQVYQRYRDDLPPEHVYI